MKKWLPDFPQMLQAEDAEGVEVVDMVAFAAGGGENGTGWELPARAGAVPFWTIKE